MIAIGIDPGLSGAIVALTDAGELRWWDTPTLRLKAGSARRTYAVREMREMLYEMLYGRPGGTVFLEAQQAMPKQGVSSTFLTGRGYGLWEGLIVGQGCFGLEVVQPRAWQRVMLAGVPGEGKARCLIAAARLFPALPLCKPKGRVPCMDGRADAALIAAYGLRRMRGAA